MSWTTEPYTRASGRKTDCVMVAAFKSGQTALSMKDIGAMTWQTGEAD